MNILIPHSWLLEHLETKATPKQIQEYLSLCGPSVERIYNKEGEEVYDIEVTTNRVDSMSVRGIAREASVILPRFKIKAKLKKLTLPTLEKYHNFQGPALPIPTIINDPKLCHRHLGIILQDVKHQATPEWMAKRLRQIDQNVHDSIIDITNYVTHELGHPCHAFDYDKIMAYGGIIKIVTAKAGKKFTTLDGETYLTVGGEIVFENESGEIIDLPAIKGTANTSIDNKTKNVMLWIESLDAKRVRQASMQHAIRTVAAELNEKNVDPHIASPVLAFGIKLYQELCDAKIASVVFDEFPGEKKAPDIKVPFSLIKNYLGIELLALEIKGTLEKLGCIVKIDYKNQVLIVTPPSYRPDLEISADIIEEIARIYGYHLLPSVLMPTAIPLDKPENLDFTLEADIKQFLATLGLYEVYTYSMQSETLALASGYNLKEHLKIQNNLSEDRMYLRRSLIPSLVEFLDANPLENKLTVFELANIYEPQNQDLPQEKLKLSLASKLNYREFKGILETLFEKYHLEFTVKELDSSQKLASQTASLVSNQTHESFGQIYYLKDGKSAAEVDFPVFLKLQRKYPKYQAIPKTSPIVEDLTFTLQKNSQVGNIIERIYQLNTIITQVKLKDIYEQNYSFTLEYLDKQKNLSSEEIAPVRKKIVSTLEKEFGAKLVGKLE